MNNLQPILVVVDMHTAFKPPIETIRGVIEMIQAAHANNIRIINLLWKEKRDKIPFPMIPEVEDVLKMGEYVELTKDKNDGSQSIIDHYKGNIDDKFFIFCGIRYQYCIKETVLGMLTPNHLIMKQATDEWNKPDETPSLVSWHTKDDDGDVLREGNFQYNIDDITTDFDVLMKHWV